ncbi:MAG: hypothetical protein J7L63_05310 [Thermoplasmata archaeon]|nr:hypothetical protein [Thermoplasmata archaeon]
MSTSEEGIVGIDIGSAHVKVCHLTERMETEIFPVGMVASKLSEGCSRMRDIILPLLRKIIERELNRWERVHVGIVTSIEAAYPREPYLRYLREFAESYFDAKFYILHETLRPREIHTLEKWPFMSSINALRYIATRFLTDGMLIHMNSSSTLFVPVKEGFAIPLELHYSSGVGMWGGALHRHVFNITGGGVYIFGRKTYLSPTAGSIADILLEIDPSRALMLLQNHNMPVKSEEAKKRARNNLAQLLGIFENREYRNLLHGGFFDKRNQIKIASYHIYGNFLYALFENVVKIFSEVDIDVEKAHFLVSGIGEPILEESLHLFGDKVERMSQKLSGECSIILESYGAALSLQEMLGVKDEDA